MSKDLLISQHPFLVEFWEELKKNKGALFGLALLIFFIFMGMFAPILAPHDPAAVNSEATKIPAFWQQGGEIKYVFGTDDLGRDLLSRILYGARVSIAVGALIVVFSSVLGVILGGISGLYGGKIDKLIMRLMDLLMSLPSILLAIVVVAILGPGLLNAILAVGLVGLPSITRIVRSSVMAEKSKQYVSASYTFGASNFYVLFREILPNCMAPIVVQSTLAFSDGILNVAALSFLGLGVQPPTPEWGVMLSDSRAFIESNPLLVTLPGICIMLVVLSLNLLGDGLRDALDPRLKK
ncbi:MAG: ABC transporter permease subunit [Halobacteriovoraceae bacterium]|nr:ABC transporter permease subunit [Halobacteriovoraceae bacterium]